MSLLSTRISNTFAMPLPAGSNCKGLLVKIHPMEWMEKPSEIPSAGLIIGRDNACDLKLLDDSVSRRHARLRYEGPMICVDDLDSTNGVFVNEQRVQGSKSLEAGDRIRFGNQIFKLVTEEGFELQYHEVIYKMMTTDARPKFTTVDSFWTPSNENYNNRHEAFSPLPCYSSIWTVSNPSMINTDTLLEIGFCASSLDALGLYCDLAKYSLAMEAKSLRFFACPPMKSRQLQLGNVSELPSRQLLLILNRLRFLSPSVSESLATTLSIRVTQQPLFSKRTSSFIAPKKMAAIKSVCVALHHPLSAFKLLFKNLFKSPR